MYHKNYQLAARDPSGIQIKCIHIYNQEAWSLFSWPRKNRSPSTPSPQGIKFLEVLVFYKSMITWRTYHNIFQPLAHLIAKLIHWFQMFNNTHPSHSFFLKKRSSRHFRLSLYQVYVGEEYLFSITHFSLLDQLIIML